MNDKKDNGDNRWLTVAEAAGEFSISERTLQRRIASGKIISKLEHGRRLILASSVSEDVISVGTMASPLSDMLAEESERLRERVAELEEELRQQNGQRLHEVSQLTEDLRRRDEDLRREREAASEASQRHDTIVLQLTRQLDQSQRLLEWHQGPWYRRWFRRREATGQGRDA